MADKLINRYFQEVVTKEFPNQGSIPDANAYAEGKGCKGDASRDQLFLHLKIEGNRVAKIKYECSYCDPAMFVTAEIICDLVKGLTLDEISNIPLDKFSNALGGHSQQAIAHFSEAMEKVLLKAVSDYRN